jgi:hypothetical protein
VLDEPESAKGIPESALPIPESARPESALASRDPESRPASVEPESTPASITAATHVSSVATTADLLHVAGLVHSALLVHSTQKSCLTFVASVSHQGVAPPQPGTPAVARLSSEHAHGRQPGGVLAAVQTAGSDALLAMQSLTALLHNCWTVHVVPLGSIVP